MLTIECKGIRASYGKHVALDQVSFGLEAGRVLAVLGPNGSGKTTLFRLLLGFKHASEGSISILGGTPGERSVLKRMGATIESPSYYAHLTGIENLRATAYLRGMQRKGLMGSLISVIDDVGLGDAANIPCSSYSLGMRQRLALAQAIVGDPDLLILDEPTNGLDPDGVRWIREWVRDRVRDRGQTIVLATHMLHEAAQVADDLLILREGVPMFHGTLSDLCGRGANLIRIRVNDSAAASMALADAGIAAEILDANELTAGVPESECPAIARCLVEKRIDILNLGPRQTNLESKYLELMEVK